MNEELKKYASWRTEGLLDQDGVITGANELHEPLLPCWWKCYRQHNDYPVTFIDFGMSDAARKWCSERGKVIKLSIPLNLFENRQLENPKWGNRVVRKIWFQKPFAFLQTPYKRTLWIDVDCEVKGNLSILFPKAENPSGMALAHSSPEKLEKRIQKGFLKQGEKGFNSGVVAYLHGCPIVQEWALASVEMEGSYMGDQDILSRVILDQHYPVTVLPNEYNWRVSPWGDNEKALIVHWNSSSKDQFFKKMQDRL